MAVVMDDTERQLQEVSNMLQRKAAQRARQQAYQESYDKLPDWAKTASNILIGDFNKNITEPGFEDKNFVEQWEEAFKNPGILTAIPNVVGKLSKTYNYYGDPGNWDSYQDRIKYEPWMHKRDKEGNLHLHVDTLGDSIAKLLFHENPEPKLPNLEDILVDKEDGIGGGGSGNGVGISLPGLGAMPNLPKVDWQAIRDKLDNLDIDTDYEAPQKDPLVMAGQALANIDLTSNLAGDWSKAAKIAADFQQYNEEQSKNAKNKSADKKAELAMWKAMKDIALQEAQANEAMKQAEFGMRWKQLQMQSAMNQAKANMFYGPNGYYGRMTKSALDAAENEKAAQLGSVAAMNLKAENPKLSNKDLLKKLTPQLANLRAGNYPTNRVNSWTYGFVKALSEGDNNGK